MKIRRKRLSRRKASQLDCAVCKAAYHSSKDFCDCFLEELQVYRFAVFHFPAAGFVLEYPSVDHPIFLLMGRAYEEDETRALAVGLGYHFESIERSCFSCAKRGLPEAERPLIWGYGRRF